MTISSISSIRFGYLNAKTQPTPVKIQTPSAETVSDSKTIRGITRTLVATADKKIAGIKPYEPPTPIKAEPIALNDVAYKKIRGPLPPTLVPPIERIGSPLPPVAAPPDTTVSDTTKTVDADTTAKIRLPLMQPPICLAPESNALPASTGYINPITPGSVDVSTTQPVKPLEIKPLQIPPYTTGPIFIKPISELPPIHEEPQIFVASTEPVSTTSPVGNGDAADVDTTDSRTIQPIKVGPGQDPTTTKLPIRQPIILVTQPGSVDAQAAAEKAKVIANNPDGIIRTTDPVGHPYDGDPIILVTGDPVTAPIKTATVRLPIDTVDSRKPIQPIKVGPGQFPLDTIDPTTTKVDTSTVKQGRPPLQGGPVAPLTPLPEVGDLEVMPKVIKSAPIIVTTDMPKPPISAYYSRNYDQPISLYPVNELA